MNYAFIAAHEGEFPVRRMCAVLGVSPSGYYDWRQRPPSQRQQANDKLLAAIRADADDKMGVARINQFRLIIAACGGTPTDRSRVSMLTDDAEDPADKFLN